MRGFLMNEKELTLEEKWEQATIANNFLFYKVMHDNPDVCKQLLEILLEMEIDKIDMNTQEVINIDWRSKGIRLDVYAKNSNQVFDIEMQSTDTLELPERARYYQGAMDIDSLKAGDEYKDLKNSYVIFICIPDIFNKGLPVYTFENLCRQDTSVPLGDRALKYFFISTNCDKLLNEEQKAFMRLVRGNESSNAFTDRVAHLTEDAKRNNEYKRQYMEWERQKAYEFRRGKEEGKEEAKLEAAITLVNKYNASPETAANDMGIPLEKLLESLETRTKSQA
ncbi:MAG: Rpn family recombination-promoting nuclease/putative transposase [Spirochaetaceae bacterium]|nr:Rpn family recombination-promoting nuclease/putative transposase [Spirochaetaceae bacterium]